MSSQIRLSIDFADEKEMADWHNRAITAGLLPPESAIYVADSHDARIGAGIAAYVSKRYGDRPQGALWGGAKGAGDAT